MAVFKPEHPEFHDPPADPVELLEAWYRRAIRVRVREPDALALATVDDLGHPWSRMIRVIRVDAAGLLFTSHAGSRKGRDLAARPWASGVFHWPEVRQQVIVAGPVARVPDQESDELWAARPVFTHAMSSVSRQSEPLIDEEALRTQAQRLADLGTSLPRPDAFCGFRMALHAIEFWHDGSDRLHLRLRYDRIGDRWESSRLHP